MAKIMTTYNGWEEIPPYDLLFENEGFLVHNERLGNGYLSGFINFSHKKSGYKIMSAEYHPNSIAVLSRACVEVQEKFPEMLQVSTPEEAHALPNVEDIKRFIAAYLDELY